MSAPTIRAIVVDDDPELAAMTITMLARDGITGLPAGTTAEAREQLTGDTDLVLLDLTLPGGGADDLVGDLRAHHPHIAVVIVTGHTSAETQARCRALGVHGFLTKPFRAADLRTTVRAALAARPPRSLG